MRQLKYHEQRLLRKVNLLEWKKTNTSREHYVSSKYYLQDREEYSKYNKIVGMIRKLTEALSKLKDSDSTKKLVSNQLLNKLHSLGIIDDKKLSHCANVSVSSFCRRRISYLMFKNKMVPNLKDCVRFVEQGHVRMGPNQVNNPGLIVSKVMEEFLTWKDSSKIKKKILEFNGEYDDYDYV